MAAKKNAVATGSKDVPETVVLHISDIEPNYDNARSGDWTKGSSKEQASGQSFSELKTSLASEGQKIPVLVRPIPDGVKRGKGSKASYQLVYGYRRWTALKELAIESGTKLDQAPILAQIKPLDDLSARIENVVENSSRDDLTGPDLGYAAHMLSIEHARSGRGPISDNKLAQLMGKNQSYLSQLLKIWRMSTAQDLPAENREIPRRWREAMVEIPVSAMLRIAGMKDAKLQLAEFEKVLAGRQKAKEEKEAAHESGETAGAQGWIDRAKKQARKSADVIGALEREGYLSFEGNWPDALELLGCKVKDDATAKQRAAIGKEAAKAYKEALEYEPDTDSEESSEAAE